MEDMQLATISTHIAHLSHVLHTRFVKLWFSPEPEQCTEVIVENSTFKSLAVAP